MLEYAGDLELPVKPAIINRFQYLLIGLSVNDVNKNDYVTCEEYEYAVSQTYNNWCDRIFTEYPEISFPVGLTSHYLKRYNKNKKGEIETLTGRSILRRFSEELQPFIVDKCNPLWREPGAHETLEDVLNEILLKLWNHKEENPSDKRKRSLGSVTTPRIFDGKWTPKEWYAFVYAGFPSGPRAIEVFKLIDRQARYALVKSVRGRSSTSVLNHRLLAEELEQGGGGRVSMGGNATATAGSSDGVTHAAEGGGGRGEGDKPSSGSVRKKSRLSLEVAMRARTAAQEEAHHILAFNTELARLEKLKALYEEIGDAEKVAEARVLLINHLEHPPVKSTAVPVAPTSSFITSLSPTTVLTAPSPALLPAVPIMNEVNTMMMQETMAVAETNTAAPPMMTEAYTAQAMMK